MSDILNVFSGKIVRGIILWVRFVKLRCLLMGRVSTEKKRILIEKRRLH